MTLLRSALVPVLLLTTMSAQESLAILDAPLAPLPTDSAPFQQLLDWDGDGDLDAVGVRARFDGNEFQVQAWRNDLGAFIETYRHLFAASSATVAPLAVDDVDGDGRTDFLIAAGPVLHTFLSTGNGQFTRSAQPVNGVITALLVVDVDRDGNRDRVLLRRDATNTAFSTLEVVWGGGGGSVVFAGIFGVSGLLAMEYDGDPHLEIGATQQPAAVFWFDVQRSGMTHLHAIWRTATNQFPVGWTQADFDGDGDLDLLSFEHKIGGNCQLWRRTGPGSHVPEPPFAGDPLQQFVDLDGDGDLDAFGSTGYADNDNYFSYPYQQMLAIRSSFCIGWNDGTGRFSTANWPGHGNWTFAGAADLDRDGDLDLVAGGAIHYGRGPWLSAPVLPTGLPPLSLARLLDLDRDGDLDLAASQYVALWNDGTGAFAVAPRWGVQWPPNLGFTGEWIEGDFDGDGAPDLLSGQGPLQSGRPVFAEMVRLDNNGGGRWHHAGAAAAPGVRMGDALTADQDKTADWDGDGDLDVAIRSGYAPSGRTDLFANDGTGRFTPIAGYDRETLIGFADFDGDGRVDAVATQSFGSTMLVVRLGTGNAAQPFGAAIAVAPAVDFASQVGDLSDDGRADLIQIDAAGQVLVLTNVTTTTGSPQFVSAAIAGPRLNPGARYLLADFDGDGRTDLLAGHLRTNGHLSAIWRRIGTSMPLGAADFAPRVLVVNPGRVGDVDGDLDQDLVGPWLVRNRSFDGPLAPAHQQYGVGVGGEDSAVPLLGTTGPLRAGRPGSLVLNSIAGPGVAAFVLAGAVASLPGVPLPGHTALVDPNGALVVPVVVSSGSGGRAAAEAALLLTVPGAAAGMTFFLQGFALDPLAASGVAASQGLGVRVGG